jgi:bla regulator protein blaR1
LDILFAELVLIVQWFNPFAWQYRKEIEKNLEFLTDNQLVQKEHVENRATK